jgi:hypothetical protein
LGIIASLGLDKNEKVRLGTRSVQVWKDPQHPREDIIYPDCTRRNLESSLLPSFLSYSKLLCLTTSTDFLLDASIEIFTKSKAEILIFRFNLLAKSFFIYVHFCSYYLVELSSIVPSLTLSSVRHELLYIRMRLCPIIIDH